MTKPPKCGGKGEPMCGGAGGFGFPGLNIPGLGGTAGRAGQFISASSSLGSFFVCFCFCSVIGIFVMLSILDKAED